MHCKTAQFPLTLAKSLIFYLDHLLLNSTGADALATTNPVKVNQVVQTERRTAENLKKKTSESNFFFLNNKLKINGI
jgi:isoaspartyl peptidase/L-asparaginase-like protein (Ntn-hydrolase superfamily)